MADLTDVLGGNRFKAAAYSRTARVLGELTRDVSAMDTAELVELPGVGKGSAERIREYIQDGVVTEHQDLLRQVPRGVIDVMDVPGIGPKTAGLLYKEGGVDSLATLAEKLEKDEESLAKLKGLGKKKLEQIRNNMKFAAAAQDRQRIGTAMPLAERTVEAVERFPGVERAAYAGSLRRGKETIGDIDILVSAKPEAASGIMEAFVALPMVRDVLAKGELKSSVRASLDEASDKRSMQVDFKVIPPGRWGAAMMYFTGSKEHNVHLRERAISQGMTLNEYGLFRGKAKAKPGEGESWASIEPVAASEESEVYKALDLQWVPPETAGKRGGRWRWQKMMNCQP